jgi:hypothetical protein
MRQEEQHGRHVHNPAGPKDKDARHLIVEVAERSVKSGSVADIARTPVKLIGVSRHPN